MSKLIPYFCGYKEDDWVILSFHYTNRQAKVQGYNESPVPAYGSDDYLHWRCWKADEKYMSFSESHKPHVVDSYSGNFDTWGEALRNLEVEHA